MGATTALDVTAGYFHTCALLATGQVQCWGDNELRQAGRDSVSNGPVIAPTTVMTLSEFDRIHADGFDGAP